MGYSAGFLRGILAIVVAVCVAALLAGAANEVLDLGWWENGYPAIAGGGSGAGFGSFAIRLGALIVVAVALNVLIDRLDPPRPR